MSINGPVEDTPSGILSLFDAEGFSEVFIRVPLKGLIYSKPLFIIIIYGKGERQ
jgi:hypothetical protein